MTFVLHGQLDDQRVLLYSHILLCPGPVPSGIQLGLFFTLEMTWRHQLHLAVVIQNANSFPEICSENMRQQ